MQAEHYNGLIAVWKEQGYTSHDVVAKLRGILHQKKIGHTGTLDPQAKGVLAVGLGLGTKTFDLLPDHWKTYEAEVTFGVQTDTEDIWGNVLKTHDVSKTPEEITQAICSFEGTYDQIPPMYSALKYNGQKLYELARKGIEIERKPRTVHINTLRVNDINLSDKQKTVTITVDCSKGTYIRSLCDDIGKKLGCGACMMKLTRTRVGEFMLDDTLTLNQISALVLKGEIEDRITGIDKIFSDYQEITFAEEYSRYLHNGNKLSREQIPADVAINDNEKYRVYDSDKCFIGVYEFRDEVLYPVKIFYEDNK
jgi:tRNA pseudouridine55 synthase